MAETLLNRARLANSPMALPFEIPNTQTQILGSGVVATAPLVALAYSYAVLELEGNSTHAGNKIVVACGDYSLTITLDADGTAEVSLLAFIRNAVLSSGVLDNPLYCDNTADFQQNNYRGFIDVVLTEQGQSPITIRVNYIFGNYAPKGEQVTDLYFDYHPEGETWCNVDAASHYTSAGLPTDFEDNWCNINEILEDTPTGDFVVPLDVAYYYGKDNIVFSTVNYHFRYDCREDNVVKVRWLDTNGNINVRKFVIGGKSYGASSGITWNRYHAYKEIALGYDRGADIWAELTANEVLTLGDDVIPTTHYEWLKTIASTPTVEALIGGAWTRCNIADVTVECDPRKAHFSLSFTLSLPTDDVQQF